MSTLDITEAPSIEFNESSSTIYMRSVYLARSLRLNAMLFINARTCLTLRPTRPPGRRRIVHQQKQTLVQMILFITFRVPFRTPVAPTRQTLIFNLTSNPILRHRVCFCFWAQAQCLYTYSDDFQFANDIINTSC